MKKLYLLFLMVFACYGLQAQQIVESFDDFAPLLKQTQTDTTYVINFWATWCPPCVKELPYFEQLQKSTAQQKIKTILVSLDFRKDLEIKLKPFLKQRQFSALVVALLDSKQQQWIEKVDSTWSGALPATLVYRGALRKFKEGEFENFDELSDFVQEFLDPKNSNLRQND